LVTTVTQRTSDEEDDHADERHDISDEGKQRNLQAHQTDKPDGAAHSFIHSFIDA